MQRLPTPLTTLLHHSALPALGLGAAVLCNTAVLAADPWGGTVAAGSDYVFRGVSHNQGAPAAQLDLHLRSTGGWFGGVWISTANRLPGYSGGYELNLYGGRSWALSDRWGAVARYVRYLYPQARVGRQYDYDEIALGLEFDDRLSALLALSPRHSGFSASGQLQRQRTLAAELSLQQPLLEPLALLAGVGYYDTRRLYGSAYGAWHLGVVARWGALEVNLTRLATDARAGRLFGADRADGRWVLTAAHRF